MGESSQALKIIQSAAVLSVEWLEERMNPVDFEEMIHEGTNAQEQTDWTNNHKGILITRRPTQFPTKTCISLADVFHMSNYFGLASETTA